MKIASTTLQHYITTCRHKNVTKKKTEEKIYQIELIYITFSSVKDTLRYILTFQ